MVKRTASASDKEPEQSSFDIPSEGEHLLQVVDVYTQLEHPDGFTINDPDLVFARMEVVGGNEEGRSMLNRMSLDDTYKGFFATRLFLKAIGQPYKGEQFVIDTDEWIGKQCFAKIVHNEGREGKVFANIKEYNFEKQVEQFDSGSQVESIEW